MVDSHARRVSWCIELAPTEWSLVYIETPDIVDSFSASVTSEC
jgi:hypothetical protein